jgi:hypothetical protein
MSKPDISLYVGKKVVGITRGKEPWEWGIKLEGDVEIRNKDPRETVYPSDFEILVNHGMHLMAFSLSTRDTTLHFAGPGATKISWSFAPTKYVIVDPKYGGEVYPQWPEELEEMGIPAMEGEGVSAEPSEEWAEEETKLVQAREQRVQQNAEEFLKEDADA